MSLTIEPQGAAGSKLPVWDTICFSYSTYFYNFQDVLRICWLWLAVTALLTGFANWLNFSWLAGVMADLKLPPQMQTHLTSRPVETVVLGQVAGLIFILAGLSIAVAWHRRIILGEHPGFSGSNVIAKNLWRYMGMGLAVSLPLTLPALVVVLPKFLLFPPVKTGAVSWIAMLIPVSFLLFLAAIAIMLRLILLLPARAVGDLGLTFKETWNGTRGNVWRILWGIAACTMLPMLPAQIAFVSFFGFLPSLSMFASGKFVERMAITNTILALYFLLILPIGIGFLSYSYSHFFRRT